MGKFGLQLLGNMIVPNEHENFDVKKGAVTVSLVVTDPSPWQPTKHNDEKWNEANKEMMLVRFVTNFCFVKLDI